MDKSVETEIVQAPIESVNKEATRRGKPRKWWQLGGRDVSHVSVDADIDVDSETSSRDETLVKNVDNVFEAPEALEIYKPTAKFEGSHRFDPDATWEPEEERKLVRRVSQLEQCG